MDDYSLLERISKVFGLITSSTFFISLFIIIILTVVVIVINNKVKMKIPRLFAGIGYLIIIVFVIVKYGMALYNIQDSFTDKAFSAFYFPNLITYICIILISFFVIALNFINKNKTLIFKIISVISFGIIMSLFVIILDIVMKNEIDIYSAKSIYENTDLMILIQASTAIFFIWMVIELIDFFSRKLSDRIDANEQKEKTTKTYYQNNGRIGDYNSNQSSYYLNNYYSNKTSLNNGYNSYYGIQGNNYNYNYSQQNQALYNDRVDYNNYNNYNNYNQNSNYYSSYNSMANKNNQGNEYKSVNYLNDTSYGLDNEYKSVNYLNDNSYGLDNEYKSVNYLNDNNYGLDNEYKSVNYLKGFKED